MRIAYNVVRSSTLALAAVALSTAAGAGEPLVEEVHFTSGPYELAGDLVLPEGPGPHPAVIVVAGSTP